MGCWPAPVTVALHGTLAGGTSTFAPDLQVPVGHRIAYLCVPESVACASPDSCTSLGYNYPCCDSGGMVVHLMCADMECQHPVRALRVIIRVACSVDCRTEQVARGLQHAIGHGGQGIAASNRSPANETEFGVQALNGCAECLRKVGRLMSGKRVQCVPSGTDRGVESQGLLDEKPFRTSLHRFRARMRLLRGAAVVRGRFDRAVQAALAKLRFTRGVCTLSRL